MRFTQLAQKGPAYKQEENRTDPRIDEIVEGMVQKLKAARAVYKDEPTEKNKRRVEKLEEGFARQDIKLAKGDTFDPDALKKRKVIYHSKDQQAKTKIIVEGGKLYYNSNPNVALDTKDMVSHQKGIGTGIYSINSGSNSLHVGTHQVSQLHHSTLIGGELAAGAGEIKVRAGEVMWLSNKSGHYTPSHKHLLEFLHWLEKRGVPMTFEMKVYFPDGKVKDYPSPEAYKKDIIELDPSSSDDVIDYELNKLLAYAEHLTAEVLSKHKNEWHWGSTWSGKEQAGVYDKNEQLVPHDKVRKWLKGQGKHLKQIVHNLNPEDEHDKVMLEEIKKLKGMQNDLLTFEDEVSGGEKSASPFDEFSSGEESKEEKMESGASDFFFGKESKEEESASPFDEFSSGEESKEEQKTSPFDDFFRNQKSKEEEEEEKKKQEKKEENKSKYS